MEKNKKKIKNLSKDNSALPADMTPQVVGGGRRFYEPTDVYHGCQTNGLCFSDRRYQCAVP